MLVRFCIKIFHSVLENRHFRRSAVLINHLDHNTFYVSMFLDIRFVGPKRIFCLNEVGILPSARMQICILSPFSPTAKRV